MGTTYLSSMHGSAISPARIWAVGSTGAIVLYDGSTGLWSTHAQSGTNTGGLTTSFLSRVYPVNSTSAWISSSSQRRISVRRHELGHADPADPHCHHRHLNNNATDAWAVTAATWCCVISRNGCRLLRLALVP